MRKSDKTALIVLAIPASIFLFIFGINYIAGKSVDAENNPPARHKPGPKTPDVNRAIDNMAQATVDGVLDQKRTSAPGQAAYVFDGEWGNRNLAYKETLGQSLAVWIGWQTGKTPPAVYFYSAMSGKKIGRYDGTGYHE